MLGISLSAVRAIATASSAVFASSVISFRATSRLFSVRQNGSTLAIAPAPALPMQHDRSPSVSSDTERFMPAVSADTPSEPIPLHSDAMTEVGQLVQPRQGTAKRRPAHLTHESVGAQVQLLQLVRAGSRHDTSAAATAATPWSATPVLLEKLNDSSDGGNGRLHSVIQAKIRSIWTDPSVVTSKARNA